MDLPGGGFIRQETLHRDASGLPQQRAPAKVKRILLYSEKSIMR